MFPRFIIALIFFLNVGVVCAQSYNYVHYNTQDGLAGSTVYDMCQDKDGFMWFATENGLSRYDGTHFTNFTVKDGLPDNEVLKVFADSKGRVWVGSLSKELAFYYKGKIFNKTNTAFLGDSRLSISGFCICEGDDGTIAVSDFKTIIEITKQDSVFESTSLPEFGSLNATRTFITKNYFGPGFIVVINDDDYYYYYNRKLSYFYTLDVPPNTEIGLKKFSEGRDIFIKAPASILGETRQKGVDVYISTADGAWSIDTVNYKLGEHFLAGKKISCTMDDTEGNTWFSSLGEGVYKLPSREMKTFGFEQAGNKIGKEAFTISTYDGKIVAGLGFSKLAMVKVGKLLQILNYDSELGGSVNGLLTNRLYRSLTGGDGNLYLGFDGFLARIDNGKATFAEIVSIKSISEQDDKYLLVGNFAGAYKVRKQDLHVTDTVWRGRCTDVIFDRGTHYVGTLQGLFMIRANKQQQYLGNLHPALQRRIIRTIKGTNGVLYVATADKGLLVIKNNIVQYVVNDKNGLSSNICRSLYVGENYLWVGTNKGLHKISIKDPSHIVKYSVSDGLPSDIINDVMVQDSIIWIASPKGLTYFNEEKISGVSNCNLLLLGINQNGRKVKANSYELSFRENRISFNFVAISHKSSGDIVYYYKLSGVDNVYKKTSQTEISFLSLPPGDYHFSLYAVNKFGKKSRSFEADIVVLKPVWRMWWFYFIILAITSAITARFVSKRNNSNRIRLERRSRFQRQLASLEQQALQAQMNPHFIFNCLNGIQQYILTNDKETANQYLNEFAMLIRQTLNISTKTSIPLKDEVAYLTKYLEMEKMRFGEKFDFKISVDPELLDRKVEVPSLLMQPYVENALRHGIRYKEDGVGEVNVVFSKVGDMIHCRVIDNGVGRKRAGEFKGMQHIEYQSKGTQLTAKRIRLINMITESELSSEIIDLYDDMDNPAGTEVIVRIPIFLPERAN